MFLDTISCECSSSHVMERGGRNLYLMYLLVGRLTGLWKRAQLSHKGCVTYTCTCIHTHSHLDLHLSVRSLSIASEHFCGLKVRALGKDWHINTQRHLELVLVIFMPPKNKTTTTKKKKTGST